MLAIYFFLNSEKVSARPLALQSFDSHSMKMLFNAAIRNILCKKQLKRTCNICDQRLLKAVMLLM